MGLLSAANRVLKPMGLYVNRVPAPFFNDAVVTVEPEVAPRGRVLLGYVIDPFLDMSTTPASSHTHHWESRLMAQAWLQRGYVVDVIDYNNPVFRPEHDYNFFVSARTNLQPIAARLNESCRHVVHLDTSHYVENNRDALVRLADCQRRRGTCLPASIRLIEANAAIEAAHAGVVLGNHTTVDTYAYAGKPLFPLNVPAVVDMPFNQDKDFASARNRFIWLGSDGAVHKGLDLVLEAFASLPDCHLTICGPIEKEPAFCAAYAKELAQPNIHQFGWVDVTSDAFAALVNSSAALVYPSCREGQAGAAVNCIKAGLIPIVSAESGVSVDGFGLELDDCKVDTIRNAVTTISAADPTELYTRAKASWDYGAQHFSHESYEKVYGDIVDNLMQGHANR